MKNRKIIFMIPAVFFSLLLSSPVYGALFNVSTIGELENAFLTATNNGEDDIINLSAGTYYLNIDRTPLLNIAV